MKGGEKGASKRLVYFALIVDIVTAFGFFIAVGHDAGAPNECVRPPLPAGVGSIVNCSPNHPPLYFWGTPTDGITLTGVQGSGQRSPIAYAPKASGPTVTNQNIISGTWCTGVTAGALTTSTTDTLEVIATYTFKDNNVTGGFWMTVTVFLNTAVPSQSFGSGACASTVGASSQAGVLYCPDTAHNCPSISLLLSATSKAAGTYYAWIQFAGISASVQGNSIGAAGSAIRIWDASQDNAPPAGGSTASSNLGTGAPPDATLTELPATQSYRQAAKLQSQTTTARLVITIIIAAVAGGGFTGDPACGTCTPVWIQFSADGVTWHDLCGDGTETPRIDIQQAASSTPYKSAFCTMQTGAFADNLFRAVWDNGAGPATQLSLIELELSP